MSEGQQQVRDMIVQALQGDESAINELADRLQGGVGAVDDRIAAHKALDWFKTEYRDVCEDPALYARAKELDEALARKNPESKDFKARFKAAGNQVRRERDGDQDADHKAAVREMIKARHGVDLDDGSEAEPDEFEKENTELIRQMARDRRKMQGFED